MDTKHSLEWHSKISEYSYKTVNLCVPFAAGVEARAAESVPGAVGVPGEAAVGAGRAVSVTTVQRDLRDPELGADVQLLLQSKQFKCQSAMFVLISGRLTGK